MKHENQTEDSAVNQCLRKHVFAYRQSHFYGPAARQQLRVHEHVPRHLHGILQVALHLHEDIFAGTAQHDGASLGRFAFLQKREVPVQADRDTGQLEANCRCGLSEGVTLQVSPSFEQ